MPATLATHLRCQVYLPDHPAYAPELAGFNTAVTHTPSVVVAAESADDIVHAVRFARDRGFRLAVQGTGHGAYVPSQAEVFISTRRLKEMQIDPVTRIATVGAGVQWGAVTAAAAEYGLAPVAGSSPDVGVVGLVLGGGLGPLARSHGFSSDYVVGMTVVTGDGELLDVDAERHADLFWALRGGKGGLGIVTRVQLRLVEIPSLYAGSLFFDEPDIETAFRAWTAWASEAHPLVTTSVAIVRFPAFEAVPEPFRGRRLMSLRFAYPGNVNEGVRLAAPLRQSAPVYLDALGALPLSDVAQIHNDPRNPCPSWVRGALLAPIDQEFVTTFLRYVGAGTDAPFIAAEVRHLGNMTQRDVPGGSAVGGRSGAFTLGLIGAPDPALFEQVLPAAAQQVFEALAPWMCAETNVNFMVLPRSEAHYRSAWPAATYDRLKEVRQRYDARGILMG